MTDIRSMTSDVMDATAEIVGSYVENHKVTEVELVGLIRQVYNTLNSMSGANTNAPTARKPAVEIADSVKSDYIVCLEDGKQLKMLKRHLKTSFNMTPEEYRRRWNLAPDYPMVAPNYAKRRSALAKTIGLGRRPGELRKTKPAANAGKAAA